MNKVIEKNWEIRLMHYIYHLINDAEKTRFVTKNTFIKCVEFVDNFKQSEIDGDVETKLFAVARRLCKEEVGQENFSINLTMAYKNPEEDDSNRHDNDKPKIPLSAIVNQFNKFPDEEKEVMLLKTVFEKSYQQIADIMEIDIGTVSGIVNKVIKRLASNNNSKKN